MTKLIRATRQLPTRGCTTCGTCTPHDVAALRGTGSRRRGSAGARRPGHHASGLRPCDPLSRGRRRGHFGRCGQGGLLAKAPSWANRFTERRFDVGAAYRNRTDDLRITRGLLPGRAPASCTDSTDHRIDGTRRAGTIHGPVPRTVPRPQPCVTLSCSLCVTSLRHSHQNSQHAVDPRLSHAHRGLANCGKARQLGMTLRHGQPVAG
jgi:hypothetical protein